MAKLTDHQRGGLLLGGGSLLAVAVALFTGFFLRRRVTREQREAALRIVETTDRKHSAPLKERLQEVREELVTQGEEDAAPPLGLAVKRWPLFVAGGLALLLLGYLAAGLISGGTW